MKIINRPRDILFLALSIGLTGFLLFSTFGPREAEAHHADGGVDETWSPAMNQESYWEDRFDAECTKYERHNGHIPAQYTHAVIKDGVRVRVYSDLPGQSIQAAGPVNLRNGEHHDAPHSWVMKCVQNEQPPTTTEPETPNNHHGAGGTGNDPAS